MNYSASTPEKPCDKRKVNLFVPSWLPPFLRETLWPCARATAAGRLGYTSVRMPSGAGHDAVYMKNVRPMGMIFVPCLNGRSHCPEEWLDPNQLLDGTRVLAETLLLLDRVLDSR